ncbi:phage integrase central domain-containing protein [Stakelama marina]|uniref:phage integrase central domain-containing protein n=1 Tax=Stakelama marina TaxID=2826939 RepID=UPI0024C37CDF|nr:hypothetical protein [Stakelama marina]
MSVRAKFGTWVEQGLDPVFEKRKAGGIPTFRAAALKVHAVNKKTWRNEKHEAQWLRALELFAFSTLGNIRVSEITGPMVGNGLAEIWLSKSETARAPRRRPVAHAVRGRAGQLCRGLERRSSP